MGLSSRVDDFTSLFPACFVLDIAGNLNIMHTSAIIIEAKQKIENSKKLSYMYNNSKLPCLNDLRS